MLELDKMDMGHGTHQSEGEGGDDGDKDYTEKTIIIWSARYHVGRYTDE